MLLFVDMETTGLNANTEVPLEVGLCLTDDEGNLVSEKKWRLLEDKRHFHNCIAAAKQHEIVGPMHEKSGLWDDIAHFGGLSRWEVDVKMVEWMTDQGIPEGEIPMTGNSIGSLDRPFALVHFPKFNEYLSYRNVDLSSVKELCKRLNPELYEQLRPIVENKESATHRVLDDNHACIQEYKAYIDNFLIVGD